MPQELSPANDLQGIILQELDDGPLGYAQLDNRIGWLTPQPLEIVKALRQLVSSGAVVWLCRQERHEHTEACVLRKGN